MTPGDGTFVRERLALARPPEDALEPPGAECTRAEV